MSKNTVPEAVLVENPDSDNLDKLTPGIIGTTDYLASEITCHIEAS